VKEGSKVDLKGGGRENGEARLHDGTVQNSEMRFRNKVQKVQDLKHDLSTEHRTPAYV